MERNTAKDFSVLRKHKQKEKAVWTAETMPVPCSFFCTKGFWNAKEERV